MLKGIQPPTQLSEHRLTREQRCAEFPKLATHQSNTAVGQAALQCRERVRRFLLHPPQQLPGEKRIDGYTGRELLLQRLTERRVGQQGDIENQGVDRVVVIAFLSQQVEATVQLVPGLFVVPFQSRLGARHRLIVKVDLVKIGGIPHLAGEQFHLQVRVTQGQEIGGDVGIQLKEAIAQRFQHLGQKLVTFEIAANQAGALLGRSLHKAGGQLLLTDARNQDQPAGQVVWRAAGPMPIRRGFGGAEQPRMPEYRPGAEQPRRLLPLVMHGEVFEAVAGQEDAGFPVGHKSLACMSEYVFYYVFYEYVFQKSGRLDRRRVSCSAAAPPGREDRTDQAGCYATPPAHDAPHHLRVGRLPRYRRPGRLSSEPQQRLGQGPFGRYEARC